MSEGTEQAFINHDAFEPREDGYRITTTAFETTVTITGDGDTPLYTVTASVPTLQAATAENVGQTVTTDWRETFERRLEDAPKSTRVAVELESFEVREDEKTVTVRYGFRWGTPRTAADIAKTFAEYVEGTYVEGVIPGYEYTGEVAELLGEASQGGEGGTPL